MENCAKQESVYFNFSKFYVKNVKENIKEKSFQPQQTI